MYYSTSGDILDMDKMEVGRRIRDARVAVGLTIPQVAEKANLSASYISQMERDQANPSPNALTRVAQTVGLELIESFNEQVPPPSPGNRAADESMPPRLVKRGQRKTMTYSGSKIRYVMLVPDLQHALQVHTADCPVGTHNNDEPMVHKGEEYAVVLRGEMEFRVGGNASILHEGDAIYFPGTLEHS